MIRIKEIKAFSDNYIWCISNSKNEAIIVDPGCSESVDTYLNNNDLRLKAILVTHHHFDHIGGVKKLKEKHDCCVYGFKEADFDFIDHPLIDQQYFQLLGINFKSIEVPGHTLDHIAYFAEIDVVDKDSKTIHQASLFCGDTLFSGGCGRLFEGSPAQMVASLQKIMAFPSETMVYCAHEYTLSNLKFAKTLMPNNDYLLNYEAKCESKRKNNVPTIPTRLDTELMINPFLRLADNELFTTLAASNLVTKQSPVEVFTAVRKLKDNF